MPLARMSASLRPAPISRPTRRLRDSSPVAVSTRSPRPVKPAKAAGDERGAGVGAQLQAVSDAAGDRDHVLQRTAHFHADQVGAGVDAQRGAMEGGGGGLAQGGAGAGDGQRHRQPLRDFAGKGRAG
ncbi:hypothetical protein G6F65_021105 [Rhizopus arrhizus]|nr:hypothetical protein G6F65_021105 [Rhizopus arrhizus]